MTENLTPKKNDFRRGWNAAMETAEHWVCNNCGATDDEAAVLANKLVVQMEWEREEAMREMEE